MNSIRRDRRREWIARNRLHPEHKTVTGKVLGPRGWVRKNPHNIGFVGPRGIKRIDRSQVQNSAVSLSSQIKTQSAPLELPLHQVEQPAFYIMVVLDLVGGRLNAHDRDVLGLAQRMANENGQAGAVLAVGFGLVKEENLNTAGIDRFLHIDGDQYRGYNPEQRTADLFCIQTQFDPRHILFPDSIHGGAELGRRLAARMGERPASGVWSINSTQKEENFEYTITRRANAGRRDIVQPIVKILLLLEECEQPVEDCRYECKNVVVEQDTGVITRIADEGQVDVDPNAISLAEAGFILAGGNGIGDWELFHRAAGTLGATEAASRVAVDEGFMPRDRQVGATGTFVAARVYVAVGISGAIQHLQGIEKCEKVIAVNSDSGCDMVKRADLSVIGDGDKILRALIEMIADRSKGGASDVA